MTHVADDVADLVIVSSPLQYMNAVEQRRAAAADRPADLVLIGDRHAAQGTIDELLRRQSPWRTIRRHGRRPRPHKLTPLAVRDALDAAHRAGLKRLAADLDARYRTVVIGDYRNVSQRLLAECAPHRELVLVDDGSVVPQVAAWRADAASASEPKQFDLSWFRTRAGRWLFGDPPAPEPESVTFHTIYGPVIAGLIPERDRLVGHAYDGWRGVSPCRPRSRAVWLLGSDHVEAGICDERDYRNVIVNVARTLRKEGRSELAYRPHRGENAGKVSRLAVEAGLTVTGAGLPAEIDYLDAPERPSLVAAISSSALDTLAVLDPELPLARIDIPDSYLRKRADHIRAVIKVHDEFNPNLRVIAPIPAGGSQA